MEGNWGLSRLNTALSWPQNLSLCDSSLEASGFLVEREDADIYLEREGPDIYLEREGPPCAMVLLEVP